MAIGLGAALIGSAVLGAGASIISSGNNNKAINNATNAQTQAAREQNALLAKIRGENTALQQPFVNTGYHANSAINALLGLPNTPAPGTTPAPAQTQQNALYSQLPAGMPAWKREQIQGANGYVQPANDAGIVTTTAHPTTTAPSVSPYQQAFENYQNSTGYQFRVGQGSNALNASFAARGLGNSGAAAKAAQTFGQNIASDEFGNYMNYLGQQQQVGVGAANALSGVNTTYANSVGANNNNAAAAIANGAYQRAANNNAMWGNLAGIGSNMLGWSSYR